MPIIVPPNSPLHALGTGFRHCMHYDEAYIEILVIVHDVRSLLIILELCPQASIQDKQPASLMNAMSSIESRLHCLPNTLVQSHTTDHGIWVAECCRLSTLIYISLILKKLPASDSVYDEYTEQMKLALHHTSLELCWGNQATLLLWNLFIAALAGPRGETRRWIAGQLAQVCDLLCLHNWKSVKAILATFLLLKWDEYRAVTDIWNEVQELTRKG